MFALVPSFQRGGPFMSENMEQLVVEVPKETKEVAKRKLPHGGLSSEVRDALARIAHGEEVAELKKVKDNLEDLRDKRADLKQQRDDIENQLQDVERQIERAETKLSQLRDLENEYEGRLKGLERRMHEDEIHVWLTFPEVEDIAEEYDKQPVDVINDLKDRNPGLPDEQFESKI